MKSIKTISIFALAAFAFAGCQTELELTPASPIKIGEEITITAASELGTKTVLQENNAIFWNDGDAIDILYGKAKGTFTTTLDAPAQVAAFTGTLNTVLGGTEGNQAEPQLVYGVYPSAEGVIMGKDYKDDPVVVTPFKYLQTAVDGSFDPEAFIAVASSENLNLSFNNVLSLLALTVNYEDVTSITVENIDKSLGGIGAGIINVSAPLNEKPSVVGADEQTHFVKLSGSFVAGHTYYMAVLPGTYAKGVTFTIRRGEDDPDPIVKTIDASVTAERNKVHEVVLGEAPAPELTIERLWGKYPNTGWPTDYVGANEDRTVTTDGEWVYVAKAGSSVSGIVAISVADPSVQKNVNVEGVDGGLFKTACVRTVYDPDNQKYILLASSLTTEAGHLLKIYAWKDGVDAAPTTLLSWEVGAYRRFGDFFTVTGTWKNGEIWFRNNTDNTDHKCNLCAQFVLKDGALTAQEPNAFLLGYGGSKGMGSLYFYEKGKPDVLLVTDSIGMFFDVNNGPGGKEWTNGTDYSVWAKRFGFTPFEFNGQKYIAYQHMYNAARSWLTILEDTQGTASGYMQTLIDNKIVFQAAVQIDKDEASTEVVSGATYSNNTMANCAVAVMEDHVIIVGHQQNTGLAVFKMYMK